MSNERKWTSKEDAKKSGIVKDDNRFYPKETLGDGLAHIFEIVGHENLSFTDKETGELRTDKYAIVVEEGELERFVFPRKSETRFLSNCHVGTVFMIKYTGAKAGKRANGAPFVYDSYEISIDEATVNKITP